MNSKDDKVAAVMGMIFCLAWFAVIVWHVTIARKTGRIFRFSKIPIGGSAFTSKKDDPGGFLYAVIMGYFLSAVLLFATVMAFLAGFFPSVLRSL